MRRLLPILALGLGLALAGPLAAQQVSYDEADTDNDGRVSKDEYLAERGRQFDRFDQNRDGVVSSADFARASVYRRALETIDRALAIADTDGDGVVSREDVSRIGTPMFDRADADHDGFLTEAEMDTLRNALAERRRRLG